MGPCSNLFCCQQKFHQPPHAVLSHLRFDRSKNLPGQGSSEQEQKEEQAVAKEDEGLREDA